MLPSLLPFFAAALSYKVAVVELPAASSSNKASTRLNANAQQSVDYAGQAAAAGAQVIVLPEYGVNGFSGTSNLMRRFSEPIPEPASDIPCTNSGRYSSAPTIVTLSCGARQHGIAIVASVGDSVGTKNYNTAVVFDTDGKFVAKQHKHNLWGEDNYVDIPQDCGKSVFTLSFGVTFGLFICADGIHDFPAQQMVRDGVKNFLTPIAWDSTMAQMQAMAWQQGWSLRHCANVAFSNYPWEGSAGAPGSSGSGIFSCGSVEASFFAPSDAASPILVREVQADPAPYVGQLVPQAPAATQAATGWQFARLSAGRVCSGSVCCVASGVSGDASGFVIAALDGWDGACFGETCNLASLNWRAQACAVMACSSPGNSCLMYQTATTSLQGVRLDVEMGSGTTVYPVVTAAPSCFDNPDFQDEFAGSPSWPGWTGTCIEWTGANCARAREDYGYSQQGENDIIANCPLACGQCGGGGQSQIQLAPGSEVDFVSNGTRAALEVSTSNTVVSAWLYGRLYGPDYEDLAYDCPVTGLSSAQPFLRGVRPHAAASVPPRPPMAAWTPQKQPTAASIETRGSK